MPRVYGKRTNRESIFQSSCFISSSPAKSGSERGLEPVSARASQSPIDGCAKAKTPSSVAIEDITVLVKGLDIRDDVETSPLRLHHEEESPVRRSPRIRRALQSIDPNSADTERENSPKSNNYVTTKAGTPLRPAAIAAQLRSALRRQSDADKATALIANSDGTVQSIHASRVTRQKPVEKKRSPKPKHALLTPPASPTPVTRPRRTRRVIESSSPEPETDAFTSHAQPLLDLCIDPAGRSRPTSFTTWASDLTQYFNVSKIAEASYGEVYRLSLLAPHPTLSSADESVLKIIPLTPPTCQIQNLTKAQQSRLATHSAPASVASEVRLLQRMSTIPGYANFRECRVLRGRPPPALVAAWRSFNRNIKRSEFPDPGRKTAYSDDQLWAVLEMQDAGHDLEQARLSSVWEVWDVFWGVALALAKGEEWAGFEHRDLHLGNICVRWRDNGPGNADHTRRLGCTGLETTLIDYTLSRAELEHGNVAFFDLNSDPAIFAGDQDEDYQYAIYRYMRAAVLKNDPLAAETPEKPTRRRRAGPRSPSPDLPSPWLARTPLTNLVWLHFVLHRLCEQLEAWPSEHPSAKVYKGSRERLAAAEDVERKLGALEEMLALEGLQDRGLGCAAGLAGWAVAEGWFGKEDVAGCAGLYE